MIKRQGRHRQLVPPRRLTFGLWNSLQSDLRSAENATNLDAICILPPAYTLLLYSLAFHSLALTSRCVIHGICSVMPHQQLVRHTATVIRWRREAANISALVITFHSYDTGNSIALVRISGVSDKSRWGKLL